MDLAIGPTGPDLVPARDLALRRRFPSILSSATVIDVAHVFFGWTTTASPS